MTARPMDPGPRDLFAGLYPAAVDELRVAWQQLRIPGPPPGYELGGDELNHPDPRRRFARRAIQFLSCGRGRECETLALIDKALPHGRLDLMLSEVSARPKSTAADVHPATGLTLWRTGLNFVRFCSDPAVVRDHGLGGGELHLALNCDPHTRDRESVQAAKQFHLHLLYWEGATLAALGDGQPYGAIPDPVLRRQALDPLSFLGARLVTEALAGFDLAIPGAHLLPMDEGAVVLGTRPLGAVIRLPGWEVLGSPLFEDLIRRLHLALESQAALLMGIFTGRSDTPGPWLRHPLLARERIATGIGRLPYSDSARQGLLGLAEVLDDLRPGVARRLARAAPARRMALMTLNQPCYALNLHAPVTGPGLPGGVREVHLIIQPKLFSGIGGAGLLTLGGVASVRILRGQGRFDPDQWRARSRFQRAFARFNQELLAQWGDLDLDPGPVRRYAGPVAGWTG